MRTLALLLLLAGCDRVFGLGDPYEDAAAPPGDIGPGDGTTPTGDGSGSSSSGATLIAWYKLDGDFTDAIGGANGNCSRTSGNACAFGPSRDGSGSSAVFTGDGCVTVPLFVPRPPEVTISLWISTGNGATTTVLSRPYGQMPPPYSWDLEEDFNAIRWTTISSGAGTLLSASPGITTQGWHHIAVTADLEHEVIYVDGTAQAMQPLHGVDYGADVVYIGCDALGVASARFVGDLDDLKIFDGALTASEVAALATH